MNTLRFRAIVEDQASRKLDQIRKGFDGIGGPGASASLFGNVTAKAVEKGFGLIDKAASAVVGVLGDAIQSAIAEEDSIAKLDAALRANVPAWDGQRDAIERVLQKRMALGFSDDEQRESLALLVAATKDETKALELQRVAMDLARLKRIDLKTASEGLIKVEAGSFRILKSLGIQLKDNATSEEALAAVRAVAQGQAEAYAETSGGRLLAAQIRVGEVMEKLGGYILPLAVDAIELLANGIEKLEPAFGVAAEAARLFGEGIGLIIVSTEEGGTRLANTYKRLAQDLPEKMRAGRTEAVEIARETPILIADALRDKRTAWQKALDLLGSDLEHEMSNAQEIALIKAELAGENIARGLKSKDPIVRAQTAETVRIMKERLASLNAREAGSKIGDTLAEGIRSQQANVANAAESLARQINRFIRVSSPAEAGPLSKGGGPEGWGARLGELYVEGMESTLGQVGRSLDRTLRRGRETPITGTSLGPGRGGIVGMGGATITIPLYVNGREFARATMSDVDEEMYWRQQSAGGATIEG